MSKIKIRLSGYITVSEEQKAQLLFGKKDVLVDAVKHGGFQPCGLASIPSSELGEDNGVREDVYFILNGDE